MSIFSKFIIPKLNIEFFFFLLSFFWEKFTNHWNRYEKDGVFFPFFLPPNTIFIRYSILFNWNSILFFSLPFSILIWIQNSMPLLYAKWYLFHSSLIRFLFYKKKCLFMLCLCVWVYGKKRTINSFDSHCNNDNNNNNKRGIQARKKRQTFLFNLNFSVAIIIKEFFFCWKKTLEAIDKIRYTNNIIYMNDSSI